MYTIKCGSRVIYDPLIPELAIGSPELTQEVNTLGELSFTIYPNHPYYGTLAKLATVLDVYCDGTLVWQGRVIEDEQDIEKAKNIVCEGVLAYLIDTPVRPFEYQGTVEGLFSQLIEGHNNQVNENQQFTVGTVTVTDSSDYIDRSSKSHLTTWEAIKTRLIDPLGGYLRVRWDNGVRYLDYLADFTDTSTQVIEYGENIIDLMHNQSAAETYTACIPLGARSESSHGSSDQDRLTVESVNGGKDYVINTELAEQYGVIYAPVEETIWDDVTLPANLLTKAREYLANQGTMMTDTIEIQAVDLHFLDADIESFKFCDHVLIQSEPHGISERYLVKKLTIPLDEPAKMRIGIGDTKYTLVDSTLSRETELNNRVGTIEADYVTNKTVTEIANEAINNNTSILQSAEQIVLSALEEYVKTGDYEQFKETTQTTIAVLANSVDLNFTTTTSSIEHLGNEMSQQFSQISSYIRFVDGAIVLGKSDSAIKLKILNDKIFFFSGVDSTSSTDNALAYFTSGKLYVNDASVLASLELGNFAFQPRTIGNLTFKKVRG